MWFVYDSLNECIPIVPGLWEDICVCVFHPLHTVRLEGRGTWQETVIVWREKGECD